MKAKQLSQKLRLNKNTISNLDSLEMKLAKGGTGFTNMYDYLCNSYIECGETEDISGCSEWTIFCTVNNCTAERCTVVY